MDNAACSSGFDAHHTARTGWRYRRAVAKDQCAERLNKNVEPCRQVSQVETTRGPDFD